MNRNRFEKRWLQAYAADVSKEDIEKCVIATGNYIWHVFSWNLLPKDSYLTGDSARAAYDAVDKTDAVCLIPFQRGKPSSAQGAYYGPCTGRAD